LGTTALWLLTCTPTVGSLVSPFSLTLSTSQSLEERKTRFVNDERRGSRVHSQYQHAHSEYGWPYFFSYAVDVHWKLTWSDVSGILSSWLRNFLVSASEYR
jgi:hypothetical protein